MDYPSFSKLLLVGFAIGTIFGGTSIQAATIHPTPQHAWRYSQKSAWYHDDSTSKYYRQVWDKANATWSKKGFNWKKTKGSSKTTVKNVKSNDIAWVGMTWTNSPSGMYIHKNLVVINQTLLNKLRYTKQQQINVAAHELGHALGIHHNHDNSISVMNPANRYYGIQNCDVAGMKKIYSKKYVGRSKLKSLATTNVSRGFVSHDYASEAIKQPAALKLQAKTIVCAKVAQVSDDQDFYSRIKLQQVEVLKGKFDANKTVRQSGNSFNDVADSRVLKTGEEVILALADNCDHYLPVASGNSIFVATAQANSYQQLSTGLHFKLADFNLN